MVRRVVFLIVTVLAPAALGTPSASACSFVYQSPKERVAAADIAIFGHVVWIHSRGGDPGFPGERFEAKVRISRVYKGRTGPALRVRGNTDEASCGAGVFRVGQRVAFLLDRPGSPYSINLASRTSLAELRQATGGKFHRPGRA